MRKVKKVYELGAVRVGERIAVLSSGLTWSGDETLVALCSAVAKPEDINEDDGIPAVAMLMKVRKELNAEVMYYG